MKTISSLIAFMFLSCASLLAQPKNPSDFLTAMCLPPKSSSEAVHRCPDESDTVAQRWVAKLRKLQSREQESLLKDSLSYGSPRRLPAVPQKDMDEYRALQQEVDGQRDSLIARLQRLTARPAANVLNAIRAIGEELDHDITACPKVGPLQIYDSVCVAAAEATAAKTRLVATNEFLASINSRWSSVVQPLEESFQSRETRITKLHSTTKHVLLKLQLKRLRLESWQTIEPILKTVDEVTRLAAQFTR